MINGLKKNHKEKQRDIFSKRLERARKVEQAILIWYRKNYEDPEAQLTIGYNADCDIKGTKASVEVKEDRMAHQTGYYALEFENHLGEPSGYARTTANIFCLVDWEYVCLMDINVLKDLIKGMPVKKFVDMGERFPDGKRNKGYLIPREKILTNPMVTVIERWFPVDF